MEVKSAAKIKVNARLLPAKEIHLAFSELLTNQDPEKFEELKQNLLIKIDSAEAEYNILNQETILMNEMIPKWKEEIEEATQQIEKFQEELNVLSHEKQELEDKKAEVENIEKLKAEVAKNDTSKKLREIAETEARNKADEQEYEETEKRNNTRKAGLNEIKHGLNVFFRREETKTVQDPEPETKEQT